MKIFLAGANGKNQILSAMLLRERERSGSRVGVADENISCRSDDFRNNEEDRHRIRTRGGMGSLPYILESFYYADADTERLIPYMKDFLLDSGAFTFMQNSSSHVNWDEYIEKYADFIKRNKVEKFFELDIDSVVGYEKVLEYRRKLERLVGKPCIPVWHKSRGIKEYQRHCEEYSYISIGGYVIKEIKPSEYSNFPAMIRMAHEKDCKVHCLGYTNLANLKKHHFDSVDSTAWTTGNRFGYFYKFDGKTVKKIEAPKGKRLADPKKVALNNFNEWVKFQNYADTHL